MLYFIILWLFDLPPTSLSVRTTRLIQPIDQVATAQIVAGDTLPDGTLPFRSDTTTRQTADMSSETMVVGNALPGDSMPRPNRPFITVERREAEPFMKHHIGFVRDFIDRLNYQSTPANEPFDAASRQMHPRAPYVRSLFNEEDPRLNPRSAKFNPLYQLTVRDFSEEVAVDTARLYIPDLAERLFGEVVYIMRYKGTSRPVRFFLKMTRTSDYYEWKIIDAEAPFLKPASPDTARQHLAKRDTSLFIASQTHETDFLALYNHLHARRNLMAFVADTPPTQGRLVALSRAVESGIILVEGTQSVNLYLNTGRGWILRLNELNRAKDNAGWLVTELYGHTSPARLPLPLARYLGWASPHSPK